MQAEVIQRVDEARIDGQRRRSGNRSLRDWVEREKGFELHRLLVELVIELDAPTRSSIATMDLGDGWIVVRASDETRVMSALRPGTERRRTSWNTAVERTHERSINFVASMGSWTIVLGDGLPNGPMTHLETRLRWLSRTFGEAQAFVANPSAGRYRWLRAVAGEVVRTFATENDVIICDLGAPTEGGPAATPDESDGPRFLAAPPRPRVDAAEVRRVAALWSVAPALFASDAPTGLAVERSASALSSDPLAMPIAAVASRKEAALHVIWLFRQGCPRCGEPEIDLAKDMSSDRRGYEAVLDCSTCGVRCTLHYTAGTGWDEQPQDSEPRLTALSTPSPLLPPSFLLAMFEQRATDAQKFEDRSFARGALEALDELLKHRDFVVPDQAALARVGAWLRDLSGR